MLLSIPPAFGLDISDTNLKLMWLDRRGKKTVIKSFGSQPVPEGLINRGEINHVDDVASLIVKLAKNLEGKKLRSNLVIANLPETRTFIKVLEIPATPESELEEFLKKEIENHFPISSQEIYLKWEVLTPPSLNPSADRPTLQNEKMQVLVGVAPQKIVDNYLKLMELAGLKPQALEIEALAIARSLLSHKITGEDVHGAEMIIDLGANRSSLIIYDHHTVQFSLSLPISGRQITEEIAQTLKLEPTQAEEIKIMCGLDETRCQGALKELISQIMNELATRGREALEYYYDNFSEANAVNNVILCGGGAKLIGLEEHLSKLLKLPVNIANPFVNFNFTDLKQAGSFPVQESLSYTTAIGLALRGLTL